MRGLLVALSLLLAACAPMRPTPEETRAIGDGAMKTYLDAINANDAGRVLAVMTEDVVLMPPHEPALIGKAKVRPWVEGYFGAYAARWEKTSEEFVIAGDLAYERYRYHSFDTAKTGGVRIEDVGKGLIVYRRGDDGKWRVARDAWSSDNPITAE
jgi:ketosteroid isomerase-like protein